MTAPRILVVGRHPAIMVKVQALIESAGYTHLGALTDEEAIALMRSAAPDALLLGGGVEPESRATLSAAFEAARPGCPVIEHSGGPRGLLERLGERWPRS
jgi:DNA-binding NtrC family response regulator